MKYVLLVLAVLVLLWLIKGARRVPPEPRAPQAKDGPSPMVRCAQCGLHLPTGEALPGRGGVFCGDAHRTEYEMKHPGA
jgi:uncharacterized protein